MKATKITQTVFLLLLLMVTISCKEAIEDMLSTEIAEETNDGLEDKSKYD